MNMGKSSETEIYIGNLSPNVEETSLEAAFSLCGKIVEGKTLVVKYRDHSGLRAYGFITFEDQESAQKAKGFIKAVLVDETENVGYPLVIFFAAEYRYRAAIEISEAVSEQVIIRNLRNSYGNSFYDSIQYQSGGNITLVCVDFKSEAARQKFIRIGLLFRAKPATIRDCSKRTVSIPGEQRPFTLYMCNIPPTVTEQDLRAMLRLFGPIETITIENVESYLKRGSIVFMTKEGSERAEKFSGSLVNNWPAPIKLYRPSGTKYDPDTDFPCGLRVRYFGPDVTLGQVEIKLCPDEIGSVKGVRPREWQSLGYLYMNFRTRELREKALALSGKLDLGGERPAELELTEKWMQTSVDAVSHVQDRSSINLPGNLDETLNAFSKNCQVSTLHADRLRLLDTHRAQLTKDMKLNSVLQCLQAVRAIPEIVVETINRYSGIRARQELLKAVEIRGDEAIDSLCEALVSSKQYYLASLLQPLEKDVNDNMEERYCPTGKFSWIDEKPMELTGRLDMSVEGTDGPARENQWNVWRKNSGNIYKNFSTPKGRCLIINNETFSTMENRIGTKIDCINAQKLFLELGYKVDVRDDLTAREMIHELYSFAQSKDHGQSLIVIVLTHGDKHDFYGADGEPINIDSVLTMFNGCYARHLSGKPKIFLLQACRGKSYDDGVIFNGIEETDRGTTLTKADTIYNAILNRSQEAHLPASPLASNLHLPNESDFFIGYASAPGYVSFRNNRHGSWFIQAVCEVFSHHAGEVDINDLATYVNNRIAHGKATTDDQKKQTPEWCNRLRKKFYFFPGVSTDPK